VISVKIPEFEDSDSCAIIFCTDAWCCHVLAFTLH